MHLLDIFQQLNVEGLTVLVVTHDPDVSKRCRRELRMVDGRIVEDKSRGGEQG